jgi:indolepyruvate ferredoxin oxidoreductase beta subunit
MAMGDGRSSSAALLAQAKAAALRFIGFDMARAADESQSVISAVLFGALAGAAVLPFDRAQFEATIERGGVGVKASLAAFAAAFERAAREAHAADGGHGAHAAHGGHGGHVAHAALDALDADDADGGHAAHAAHGGHAAHDGDVAHVARAAHEEPSEPSAPGSPEAASAQKLPHAAHPQVQALLDAACSSFSGATLNIVLEGLRRLVDYQDPAYAALYLERLGAVRAIAIANARGADSTLLMQETARHLALWMSYEDTIRVADLKTRDSRFARVRGEVRAEAGQVLAINEYLHPRLQEIADTLPARFGRWLLASRVPRRLVERAACKGRVVQTSSLRGYLLLSAVAGLRRWRRTTLRFGHEQARIEEWLADIRDAAATDLPLGTEIARCQRLVKGYGETHERGLRNFATLRGTWTQGQRRVPANTLALLREAALADEQGLALRAAMQGLGLESQERQA